MERNDGVVTVTLEPAGAQERRQRHHVARAAGRPSTTSATDRDDRVLVLTGAGGAFCSGADLCDRRRRRVGPATRTWSRCGPSATWPCRLHRLPKPTIAKVGGVAAGAGMSLALGCDLVRGLRHGPVLADLRQAGPVGRLRRLLAAAPTHRAAPGQGAGLLRRHPERRGGGGRSAWSTGWCPPTELDALRRRLGPARWPRARPWPCR